MELADRRTPEGLDGRNRNREGAEREDGRSVESNGASHQPCHGQPDNDWNDNAYTHHVSDRACRAISPHNRWQLIPDTSAASQRARPPTRPALGLSAEQSPD